jgi:PD-(D/E)XK nuclease superfamily
MSSPAPTRRVQRGRGHSYYLDGEQVAGVTTILRDGVPKHLEDWVARTSAGYVCDHWSELAECGTAERMRRITAARFEVLNQASARGTTVHDYAVRLAAGEELTVPDELVGHVDAYLRFVEEWRVAELIIECTVINRQWRYMGTPDLIAHVGDGRLWLLDWKTGASGIFPETALQLAAYAHAETYLDRDGDEQPMPEIAAAGAVHLRTDGYDLIPVDTSDETFRVFLYAMQVARFANAPRETYIGEALTAPRWLEAATS